MKSTALSGANASFGYQKYSSSCERSAVTIEHGHEVVGVKFVEKLQQKVWNKNKKKPNLN